MILTFFGKSFDFSHYPTILFSNMRIILIFISIIFSFFMENIQASVQPMPRIGDMAPSFQAVTTQ